MSPAHLMGCRFDRANTFRKMVDCQFVAAMGLPGGGRTFITPRFARHFHHVGICEFDSDTKTCIFSTILGHFFSKARPSPLVARATGTACSTLLTFGCQLRARPHSRTLHAAL